MKVGDTIAYRSREGKVLTAKVERIELCPAGEKYGEPMDEVNNKQLSRCTLDLDNGHWCYGDQIIRIVK